MPRTASRDQREDRAEQHHEREAREEEVVGEERGLARHRGVDSAGCVQLVRPPRDEREARDDHDAKEREQPRTDRRLRERMDRVHDARPGEERAQDGETERRQHEGDVPDPEHPAALLDDDRVDERGGGQPREQRRVLDGVPAPVPAPAEDLVAPPRAEDDADGEEPPGDEGGASGVLEPALTEPAGDQCRHRERERNREPDVAEVEHRRVERHQRVVLQQWVRAATVEWDRPVDELERVRRDRHEDEEEECDREAHEQRPRDHRVLEPVPEPPRGHRDVPGEDQRPEQDRAFERGPQAGDREEQRGAPCVVVGDVLDREVVGDAAPIPSRTPRGARRRAPRIHSDDRCESARRCDARPQREEEHTDGRRAHPERDAEYSERCLHAPPDAAFGAFFVLTFGGA